MSNEDGVRVERRTVEGTSLVEFRGRGLVEAPLLEVAAVIRDNDRKTEWMANCQSNYPVRWRSSTSAIVYHRVGSPAFFISDRDTVMDVRAEWAKEKRELTVSFFAVTDPKTPVRDDAVRMPELRGFWRLRYVSPKRTDVTYQVFADPGGSLPRWLVNWASRDIPLHSIGGLRAQVTKAGYEKDRAILELAFDLSVLDPDKVASESAKPESETRAN